MTQRLEVAKAVETVAVVALAGIDPLRFLEITNPFEQALLVRVAERARELRHDEMHNQAVMIAEQVGKLLSGKG